MREPDRVQARGADMPGRFLLAFISALYLLGAGTAIAAADRCQNEKARCAVEVGGLCNPRTGFWCIGNSGTRHCGGTMIGFLACLDRVRGSSKAGRSPPDRRAPDSTDVSRNPAVQSPNGPAWGCAATDGKARGRSWGYRNQAAASSRALLECNKKPGAHGCRVVSCRAGVHTSADAAAISFTDTHQ
jgi:hypothetical protein